MAKRGNHPKSAGGGGKAWAGRFREQTDPFVEAFTKSVTVDSRLYNEDIAGSIAGLIDRDAGFGFTEMMPAVLTSHGRAGRGDQRDE